jgi:hypothetical protein
MMKLRSVLTWFWIVLALLTWRASSDARWWHLGRRETTDGK